MANQSAESYQLCFQLLHSLYLVEFIVLFFG